MVDGIWGARWVNAELQANAGRLLPQPNEARWMMIFLGWLHTEKLQNRLARVWPKSIGAARTKCLSCQRHALYHFLADILFQSNNAYIFKLLSALLAFSVFLDATFREVYSRLADRESSSG